jgi:hypothetical protein
MKKTLISLALATSLLVPAQGVLAETKELARGNQSDVAYDVLIARPAAWFYFASGVVQYVPAVAVHGELLIRHAQVRVAGILPFNLGRC